MGFEALIWVKTVAVLAAILCLLTCLLEKRTIALGQGRQKDRLQLCANEPPNERNDRGPGGDIDGNEDGGPNQHHA